MVEHHGSFVWYELMTTDMAAAATFYANVVGRRAQDASTPDQAYTLFTAGSISLGGLMGLPEDAQKMGAPGRDTVFDGVCRGQRRGRCCRPDQASWRGRVRPADEQQHRLRSSPTRPHNFQNWFICRLLGTSVVRNSRGPYHSLGMKVCLFRS